MEAIDPPLKNGLEGDGMAVNPKPSKKTRAGPWPEVLPASQISEFETTSKP